MKVSIITATNNSQKTVEDCIKSIREQEYQNIEHIIIDNKSTDSTLNIINRNKKNNNFIKLISEFDNGIYDALNKGINHASGDIIGFLHSDDIFYNCHTIFDIVSFLKKNKYDGVYGNLQYVKKNNTNKVVRFWKSSKFDQNLLKKGWMPPHPTLFLRKYVYDKHGKFNDFFQISADYDFILRVFKDQELTLGYFPSVITRMRVGGVSNRSFKNIIKKSVEDYNAIKNNNIGNFKTLIGKNISKVKQFF